MAFLSLFDQSDIEGSGVSTAKEQWYNIKTVPVGKKIWPGFAFFMTWNKDMKFELRGNKPGQSAGTLAATDRIGLLGLKAGEGDDMNIYKDSLVRQKTAPMDVLSTGVENLWLRTVSNSNSAGEFDYQVDYALLEE